MTTAGYSVGVPNHHGLIALGVLSPNSRDASVMLQQLIDLQIGPRCRHAEQEGAMESGSSRRGKTIHRGPKTRLLHFSTSPCFPVQHATLPLLDSYALKSIADEAEALRPNLPSMLSYNTPEKRAVGGLGYVILSVTLAILCMSNDPQACFRNPRQSTGKHGKPGRDGKDMKSLDQSKKKASRHRHSNHQQQDDDPPPRRVRHSSQTKRRTASSPMPIDEEGVTLSPHHHYHSPYPHRHHQPQHVRFGQESSARRA